jgi:hypothetical protein
LENQLLNASPQQCFLMGYRALCRELFLKRLHHESIKILREMDRGRSVKHQEMVQFVADLTQIGTSMGCAEMEYQKRWYDDILIRSAWDEYHSLVVEFAAGPEILYTGGFLPEFDFSGNTLQNLMDQPPLSFITATVMPCDSGGMAILGWEGHSSAVCTRFAESLRDVPADDLGNAIVRLGFEHIENTFSRPSWWESLPSPMKSALIRRLQAGANPEVAREPDCLKSDGNCYITWPVTRVTMN